MEREVLGPVKARCLSVGEREDREARVGGWVGAHSLFQDPSAPSVLSLTPPLGTLCSVQWLAESIHLFKGSMHQSRGIPGQGSRSVWVGDQMEQG